LVNGTHKIAGFLFAESTVTVLQVVCGAGLAMDSGAVVSLDARRTVCNVLLGVFFCMGQYGLYIVTYIYVRSARATIFCQKNDGLDADFPV